MANSISRPKLLGYVRKAHIYGKNEEPLRLIALRHVTADERANPVDEWQVRTGFDVETTVDQMINAAESDAAGLDGIQQYVFHFYFGTSKNPGARFTAKIEAAFSDDDGDETVRRSEGANGKGLIAQAMRHQEVNAKIAVGSAAESIRLLRDIIDTQAEELKSLRDGQRDTFKMMEENLRDRLAIEKERMQMNDNGAMVREGMEILKQVGVPVLKNALGIPMLPQTSQSTQEAQAAQSKPQAADETPAQYRDRTVRETLMLIGTKPEKWLGLKQLFEDMPQVLIGFQNVVNSFESENPAAAAQ